MIGAVPDRCRSGAAAWWAGATRRLEGAVGPRDQGEATLDEGADAVPEVEGANGGAGLGAADDQELC